MILKPSHFKGNDLFKVIGGRSGRTKAPNLTVCMTLSVIQHLVLAMGDPEEELNGKGQVFQWKRLHF